MKIRRCSYTEILGPDTTQGLLEEYAAECSVAADPQYHMYEALERCGGLQCFGAWVQDQLVGFCSVIVSVMPHHGQRVASIESIFVANEYRWTGAGLQLLSVAECYAAEQGCIVLLYQPRVGSAMESILSRRHGVKRTHSVYTRRFETAEDPEGRLQALSLPMISQ